MHGIDLGVRVKKLKLKWVFGKNRMYGSVNVLGGAIRVNCFTQCDMKTRRAGHFNFLPTFLHLLSAIFGIYIKQSRKTHDLNI